MWDELGIAPCHDAKAIRRAYAARLKKLDPDRDPEAFARLRYALQWALDGGDGDHRDDDELASAASPPNTTHGDTGAAAEESAAASPPEPPPDHGEPEAAPAAMPPADDAPAPQLPPVPPANQEEIRDRALLIALDAALRRHDATQATTLYYRAAATGALSLASAPDVVERLIAVAADDRALDAASLRGLIRTLGLGAPASRAAVLPEPQQRLLARLRAEDWYAELLVTATQRKGRTARRRAKIARLLLGRIGKHWHPRVDKMALKSWLDQYRIHAAWLQDRFDPAWIAKLDGRLRRREMVSLSFFGLIIGSLLIQFVYVFWVSLTEGFDPLWPVLAGPFALVFLLWLMWMITTALLKLAIPGWSGFGATARLRGWAGRLGAIWRRRSSKRT
jgi:hypothetical protein